MESEHPQAKYSILHKYKVSNPGPWLTQNPVNIRLLVPNRVNITNINPTPIRTSSPNPVNFPESQPPSSDSANVLSCPPCSVHTYKINPLWAENELVIEVSMEVSQKVIQEMTDEEAGKFNLDVVTYLQVRLAQCQKLLF